jgi:hypothetical protein
MGNVVVGCKSSSYGLIIAIFPSGHGETICSVCVVNCQN